MSEAPLSLGFRVKSLPKKFSEIPDMISVFLEIFYSKVLAFRNPRPIL